MKKIILILISSTLFYAGCATSNATYKPPVQENISKKNYTRTINKPFDEVWQNLVSYAATTFFAIDNFEKDSGLLTLSFGASNPEEYITGGDWYIEERNFVSKLNFEGDYVEYAKLYLNGGLTGKMNIVLTKVNNAQTKITITARYIFSISHQIQQGVYNQTWNFDTGNCQSKNIGNPTKGTPSTRTICPTYKAENTILNAIEGL